MKEKHNSLQFRKWIYEKGKIPQINTVVDAYNLISTKYQISAGCHDLDNIKGDILTLKTYDQLMKNKVKRLKKAYNLKNKLKTEEKYNKSFRRMFSMLSSLNKILM